MISLLKYLDIFFFKDFIYLFMRDTEREREREKQAPHKEPDVGLDPRTPGSCPGPKVGAKLPSHLGIPPRAPSYSIIVPFFIAYCTNFMNTEPS